VFVVGFSTQYDDNFYQTPKPKPKALNFFLAEEVGKVSGVAHDHQLRFVTTFAQDISTPTSSPPMPLTYPPTLLPLENKPPMNLRVSSL